MVQQSAMSLAHAFLERVGASGEGSAEAEAMDRAALAETLTARLADAARAWPTVVVDQGAFVLRLAACLPPGKPLAAALSETRVDDLYLAFACAAGDAHALAAFDRELAAECVAVTNQVRGAQLAPEDLRQMLADRLFSLPTPKIEDYTGQGKLRNWVRVAAVRLCVDAARKRSGNERPMAPEHVPDVIDVAADPELMFLKREHREHMRGALEEAARELSAEDRNLLRHHHVGGMSIDELAAAHGIHRATAARRLQRAREMLLEGTRSRLMSRLAVSGDELDSMVRAAQSQFHVTLERVLRSVG
jgi:RNA polymerase sigma-70 factor (ECF subfamily)